jgi:hypothetical protein
MEPDDLDLLGVMPITSPTGKIFKLTVPCQHGVYRFTWTHCICIYCGEEKARVLDNE